MIGVIDVGGGMRGIYTAGVAQEYINLRNLMVGREVVELAPGPDTFAAETKLRLYYDQQAQAFYTRVMPEACPLADGMSDSLWRFYFDAQLQDLRTNGNTYQKRWAQTFYA